MKPVPATADAETAMGAARRGEGMMRRILNEVAGGSAMMAVACEPTRGAARRESYPGQTEVGMERAFLDSLRERADDPVTRLVYADWLDEQSDGEARTKAEYLRVEARLLEATKRRVGGLPADGELALTMQKTDLAMQLPNDWLALVACLPIENCGEEGCPRRWESLTVFEDTPRQRFCKECGKRVYWCESIAEARENVHGGQRVVIDERVLRKANDLALSVQGSWLG
jgi:uncharacterized protein (TIGR02996 family)